MSICIYKALISSKTWIFLTLITVFLCFAVINIPDRYETQQTNSETIVRSHTNNLDKQTEYSWGLVAENRDKSNNKAHYITNKYLTNDTRIVQFSGSNIDQRGYKSTVTEDESNRSSAARNTREPEQLQGQATAAGKVKTPEESTSRKQLYRKNLNTSYHGNSIQTSKLESYYKRETRKLYGNYQNLLQADPPKYLQNFKNPCWNESEDDLEFRIRCLPYFYLGGFPKCGTTDLFHEMSKHPDILPSRSKEPHWWTRIRFINASRNFDVYLKYFKAASEEIAAFSDEDGFHYLITGEGSASTLWDIRQTRYPDNINETEPKVVLANEIHHITPQAKLIAILRNPTSRLYSDYLYFAKTGGFPNVFHDLVKEDLAYMKGCLLNVPERSCAFYTSSKLRTRLHIGMYAVFLEEWLKVFPREQVHILRLEDYKEDKEQALSDVFQFLGLGQIPHDTSLFNSTAKRNARKQADAEKGPMFPETKQLLDDFYRPYNTRLAHLLNDERYLWLSSP